MSYADSWDSWTDEDVWTITEEEPTGPTEEDTAWWDEQTREDQDHDQAGDWTEAEDADAIADAMAGESAAIDAHQEGRTFY